VDDTNAYQEDGVPVPYRSVKKKQPKGMGQTWYYFGVAGEIGFSIALPIAGGALIGSRIDQWFVSYPRYTIILLFIGIVLSMVNFIFVVQSIVKRQ